MKLAKFNFILLFCLLLIACGTPPRLETPLVSPTPAPKIVLPAPTATATPLANSLTDVAVGVNPSLTIWVNETSIPHEEMLAEIGASFEATHNIDLIWRLVRPELLPNLVETAVLSNTLPDLIIHPLEYSLDWGERGVFNTSLTAEIRDQLGQETFSPTAFDLATTQTGNPSALPLHGYQNLLFYRADWYAEQNLQPPTTYETMFAGAEGVYNPVPLTSTITATFISGFVIPTESNLISTHQMFEHLAIANGCQLVDERGEIQLLSSECQESLEFYFRIVNRFSPPGVQTDTSAQNAFLEGRTGMIMDSPSLLVSLAGLNETRPSCPLCTSDYYLAQNTGVLTSIQGNSANEPANFAHLTLLGITNQADPERTKTFATFFFEEAYPLWLSVESERKVPLRWGTAVNPRQFIDTWGQLPLRPNSDTTLNEVYGEELMTQLRDGVGASPRWGFRVGEARLMSQLYQKLTISVVLQEMLSGYFNTDKTLAEAYLRVIELIPNYPYELQLDPTPVP